MLKRNLAVWRRAVTSRAGPLSAKFIMTKEQEDKIEEQSRQLIENKSSCSKIDRNSPPRS
jgi:hypothetical protein